MDLIEREGRTVVHISRALDQARRIDDLDELHVEAFHDGPRGLVVSLGESDDLANTQHVEAELEASCANLGSESLATHPVANCPSQLWSTVVIDHGEAGASSADQRSIRSTVSDPLAYAVLRPSPMHLDGEATGFGFGPSACIPVGDVRVGMQPNQIWVCSGPIGVRISRSVRMAMTSSLGLPGGAARS